MQAQCSAGRSGQTNTRRIRPCGAASRGPATYPTGGDRQPQRLPQRHAKRPLPYVTYARAAHLPQPAGRHYIAADGTKRSHRYRHPQSDRCQLYRRYRGAAPLIRSLWRSSSGDLGHKDTHGPGGGRGPGAETRSRHRGRAALTRFPRHIAGRATVHQPRFGARSRAQAITRQRAMDTEILRKERVLVLAPTPADAALSRAILDEAGLFCEMCVDPGQLSRALRVGAGAALLTDEVHRSRGAAELVAAVQSQPPWSDIPILLLSSSGADSRAAAWAMEMLSNVTVLERPIRVTTLVSALRTAIRARRRQYELCEQIEAVQQSEERLRLAIEFAQLGLWEWDIVTDEVRTLHYARDLPVPRATVGESLGYLHPDDRDRVQKALHEALNGGNRYESEFRMPTADGQLRWLSGKGEIIRDGSGRPVRMLGVNHDITQRKQDEEALKEADHRKDKFLATLAHELRNPLASIRNALQVMRLASSDRDLMEQARSMMDLQLDQMVRLIDDLLDVSRISTGKLALRKERVELAAVITNAVDTARPVIEAACHELIIKLTPQPVFLDADPMRLAQVFANLLNNAAKYTDRGGRIWLTASYEDDQLAVSVRDTGIGIPPEH